MCIFYRFVQAHSMLPYTFSYIRRARCLVFWDVEDYVGPIAGYPCEFYPHKGKRAKLNSGWNLFNLANIQALLDTKHVVTFGDMHSCKCGSYLLVSSCFNSFKNSIWMSSPFVCSGPKGVINTGSIDFRRLIIFKFPVKVRINYSRSHLIVDLYMVVKVRFDSSPESAKP